MFETKRYLFIHFSGGTVYIISSTVFCFVLPGIVIIASHVCILHQVRQAGQMFSNRAARGKQSSEAEMQLIRVLLSFFVFSRNLLIFSMTTASLKMDLHSHYS